MFISNMSPLLLVSSILCLLPASTAQSTGWRMVDRFYGFRFEISGSNILGLDFQKSIQQKADELACFGWVQESGADTLVGEARCSKSNGPKFESWLKSGYSEAAVDTVEVKVYDDTKIRLHFAYFKILDKSRDTCFLDRPHMCSAVNEKEFAASSSDEL